MLQQVKGMSERFACRAVGLHRSTYRRLPAAQTPADPDAGAKIAFASSRRVRRPTEGSLLQEFERVGDELVVVLEDAAVSGVLVQLEGAVG